MKLKAWTICSTLGLLVVTAACESKNAAVPTAPGTGALVQATVADVTIAPPTLASADGAQIKNVNQPVTLAIGSAVATGSRALTYTIEVASDAAFGTIVYTKSGLAADASQVIDKLSPDKTYYWRARATSGSLPGPNSKPRSFTIGPQVLLSTPATASPSSSGVVGAQVTLTANNVQKTGPAGQVLYRFQVADSSSFGNIVFDSTVAEQGGGTTSVSVTAKLSNGTYWWHVQASDASNAVTTSYSGAASFQVQLFDLHQATMEDNPSDFANWPETASITSVVFTDNAILVDFDKRQGPDRWPDAGFGATGSIEYTLGMCLNINDHWYCSAAILFWAGRELEASGLPSEISRNWYYDQRWGPMAGYQPSDGELVGIFVGQGALRGSGNTYKERSNVVMMPFGGTYFKEGTAGAARMRSLLPSIRR
jgi:hypothetical protein